MGKKQYEYTKGYNFISNHERVFVLADTIEEAFEKMKARGFDNISSKPYQETQVVS